MFSKALLILAALTIVQSEVVRVRNSGRNFLIQTDDKRKDWWQTATFYQIYPKSYKDSNGDGIGDLQGIRQQLDYIQNLGVSAIWLSPIYKSPLKDGGYDISDFRDINPQFGTLEDFMELLNDAHKRGIKLSIFKGSAWEYHPVRKQFYFHQFLKEQPDLNFRNDKVRQEMKDVLTYWLEVMDVDGVRVDAVPHLLEDDQLRDEPLSNCQDCKPSDYEYLEHTRTVNQNGSFELVVMMTEAATDIDNVIRYYGKDGDKGAHFSFNFWLEGLTKDNINADELKRIVSTWMTKLGDLTPNWVLGNHDNHRIATKVGEERADGLNMLTGFLPGVQVTYAGEEIAMEDGEVNCEDGDDFHEDCSLYDTMSRDFERTPFQWDNTATAGFSNNTKTWLPVSSKKDKCNVKAEQETERSHLKTYSNIQKLRKEFGNLSNTVEVNKLEDSVLQIIRHVYIDNNVKDDQLYAYHYFFNLKDQIVNFDFADTVKLKKYIVLAASSNGKTDAGNIIDGSHLKLDAYESITDVHRIVKMFAKTLLVLAALPFVQPGVVHVKSSGRNFLIQTDDKQKDWWQTATFYQIYPKSFKDSNGDGIGDLQGIRQQLDYIQSLGVTAIWLSPIYKSPLKDEGYDVILDFVPNHTSDKHPWFELSANRVKGFEDYYLSCFKGSAWEYHPVRKQFYLHKFLKEQPDLNYRNDKVKQEMKDVLTYWLEVMDVDGVRIDAVPHLIEDDQLRDEPLSNCPDCKPSDYEYLDHTRTVNQNGTFDVVYEWRAHLDEISKRKNYTRVMMTEGPTDIDNVIRYYGKDGVKGAHFSFNFWFLALTKSNINAAEINSIVSTWMTKLSGLTPNWVLGNHDTHRIATKVGEEKADGLNMLTGFLPGVQVTYAGEEIAMEDGDVDCKDGDDFHNDCSIYEEMSRDFERTPFQWDNTTAAGFSNNTKTWLPVSSKKDKCNVKMEQETKRSHLKTYANIQKLRKEFGNLSDTVEVYKLDDNVVQIIRYIDSNAKDDKLYAYHYFFNLNDKNVSFDFADTVKLKKYIVLAASSNGKADAGDIIDGSHLSLDAYESVILKTYRNAANSLAGSAFAYLTLIFLRYTLI
nr:unnamed protein product [Callosobruchus analis]